MFQRQCRITSSNCKDVICLKNGHTGLINRLLWASSSVTPAFLYDQENESNALEQYEKEILMWKTQNTGLWLNSAYPQLGCNPDGLKTGHTVWRTSKDQTSIHLKHCDPNNLNNENRRFNTKKIEQLQCENVVRVFNGTFCSKFWIFFILSITRTRCIPSLTMF